MARVRLLALASLIALGCASDPRPVSPWGTPVEEGDALRFSFGTTEGLELSSSTTRGRATAILFLTTYDPVSQVLAKRLDRVLRSHTPRANGGAVVLEAPKYAVLADVYREQLGLSYPVALADAATLQGRGPFGHVDRVPTLVVLDRSGREVWRHVGLVDAAVLEQALAKASRRGDPRAR